MPRVRLKFKPTSERLIDFSADHPDEELRILSSRPTEEGLLSVVEAETTIPETIVRYVDEAPEVCSVEVLQADHDSLLFQYVITEPTPHRVARETGYLGTFPLIIRGGWIFVEAVTTHNRLSQFTAGLEAADVRFEILSITQSVDVLDLLTDRQWQFITEAVEHGYYDSPRRCSLVDLAAALDVDTSTASGILHRAEERVIKEFVGSPSV